jgi:2-hydroxycyclohexanecarboxyl-CoA dehydrogenase
MDLYLQGQSVAVIGAGNGIGRAIAMGFVAEGCQVYGFDRDVKAATVPGMKALVTGDVSKLDEVRAFADQMGEADHVIFCVGIGSGKFGFPFWNLEPSDWMRVLEINSDRRGECGARFCSRTD